MEVGILIFQINGYQFIKGQLIIFFKSAKRMRVSDSLCTYNPARYHLSPSPHEHNPAMVLQLPFVSLHLLFTKIKASKNYT